MYQFKTAVQTRKWVLSTKNFKTLIAITMNYDLNEWNFEKVMQKKKKDKAKKMIIKL